MIHSHWITHSKSILRTITTWHVHKDGMASTEEWDDLSSEEHILLQDTFSNWLKPILRSTVSHKPTLRKSVAVRRNRCSEHLVQYVETYLKEICWNLSSESISTWRNWAPQYRFNIMKTISFVSFLLMETDFQKFDFCPYGLHM